ncbi:MAG TPA: mersacidin/lichenicidin family type 2 lantibiotic [Thermoanaerobaculia bacterium]|jgi:mersacidin/lichenicidin family type 2 lantibiotic
MNKTDPIRAWKDPVYRASLSARERAELPAHPAGILELDDEQLKGTAGGTTTAPTCTDYTFHNLRYCCPSPTTA